MGSLGDNKDPRVSTCRRSDEPSNRRAQKSLRRVRFESFLVRIRTADVLLYAVVPPAFVSPRDVHSCFGCVVRWFRFQFLALVYQNTREWIVVDGCLALKQVLLASFLTNFFLAIPTSVRPVCPCL